ncbi:hypothetical protein pipiens_002780 [Culex pipiens pipiens]|uniref:Uncharacterized protein n=1 Tax=Culex pipiens pipiens TaxID=38569 RepID=A0ABD1D895_CULPP
MIWTATEAIFASIFVGVREPRTNHVISERNVRLAKYPPTMRMNTATTRDVPPREPTRSSAPSAGHRPWAIAFPPSVNAIGVDSLEFVKSDVLSSEDTFLLSNRKQTTPFLDEQHDDKWGTVDVVTEQAQYLKHKVNHTSLPITPAGLQRFLVEL